MQAMHKACRDGRISVDARSCSADGSGILMCHKHWFLSRMMVQPCGEGKKCGRCRFDIDNPDYDPNIYKCQCLIEKSLSSMTLPAHGTIEFKASEKEQGFGYTSTTTNKGKVVISTSGEYLFENTKRKPDGNTDDSDYDFITEKSITIIIPHQDGTYTEYNDKYEFKDETKVVKVGRSCFKRTTSTDNRRTFEGLWKDTTTTDLASWQIDSEEEGIIKGNILGDYRSFEEYLWKWEGGYSKYNMEMKVIDEENEVIVPKMFYYYQTDGEYDDVYTNIKFDYKPLVAFNIADYCTNV